MGDLNVAEGKRPRGQWGWGAGKLKINFGNTTVAPSRAELRHSVLPEQGGK